VLTERGEEVLGSIRERQLLPGRSDRAAEHDVRAQETVGARG
jgi:hypothetical protein